MGEVWEADGGKDGGVSVCWLVVGRGGGWCRLGLGSFICRDGVVSKSWIVRRR